MYLSLLILNLIFRIILESPQSGESSKPNHFKGSKGHKTPLMLFKLANKSLSLYIFVLALWFYFVLYVFHCPKSIDCTERCYQFVIKSLLSVKNSRDILISVDHTIDLYILGSYLVDNHVIFPYRIFIVRPKADSF